MSLCMVGRIKMAPEIPHPLWYSHFLPVIQSTINLGAAVKGLCDVIKAQISWL